MQMDKYEEGLALIEERCGNGKDNILSFATIAMEPNAAGNPRPFIRDVDAYYEDGVFYVTTWAQSTKMQQIAQNQEVAFSVCQEWFSGNGIGENLGWVLDPKNSGLRSKHLPRGTISQTMNRMRTALFWQSASQGPR
jgi:hypothetical protein